MMNDEQLRALRKPPKETPDPVTDPQLGYIKILIEDRIVPRSWLEQLKIEVAAGLGKRRASEIIVKLKSLPRSPTAFDNREAKVNERRITIEMLPAMRYAIELEPVDDDANDIAFYRVKWNKSKTQFYIYQIIGPNEQPVRMRPTQIAIAKQIVRAGVGNSAALYGFKIGKCSKCHAQITNRISRKLGIGPICGGRVYEDWQERVNTARQELRALGLDPDENVDDDDA